MTDKLHRLLLCFLLSLIPLIAFSLDKSSFDSTVLLLNLNVSCINLKCGAILGTKLQFRFAPAFETSLVFLSLEFRSVGAGGTSCATSHGFFDSFHRYDTETDSVFNISKVILLQKTVFELRHEKTNVLVSDLV